MKFRTITIWGLVCGLGALSALWPRPASQGTSEQLSDREAVSLVRTANTAEATFRARANAFANLDKLVEQGFFQRPNPRSASYSPSILPTLVDATSGTVKDYKFSVVVSEDGNHYSISLMPTQPSGCRLSLFSNEAGVIYRGWALGCPVPGESKP